MCVGGGGWLVMILVIPMVNGETPQWGKGKEGGGKGGERGRGKGGRGKGGREEGWGYKNGMVQSRKLLQSTTFLFLEWNPNQTMQDIRQ